MQGRGEGRAGRELDPRACCRMGWKGRVSIGGVRARLAELTLFLPPELQVDISIPRVRWPAVVPWPLDACPCGRAPTLTVRLLGGAVLMEKATESSARHPRRAR